MRAASQLRGQKPQATGHSKPVLRDDVPLAFGLWPRASKCLKPFPDPDRTTPRRLSWTTVT
jgi:hypothetical protein